MKPNVLLGAGIGYFALAGNGFAATYNFACIPPPLLQQNCDEGAAQTSVVVTEPSPGQVLFTFFNVGSIPMKIASVYLDDRNVALQGPVTIIEAGFGIVDFAQDAPIQNPPRGANLSPPFVSEFSASKVGGGKNAVDPGESVGIQLAIVGGKNFPDVLTDLESGALRIAEHVTSFTSTNGSSESFVNTVTPSGTSSDLAVNKIGPSSVETGQSTMYTIFVQNNGPGPASDVTMTDNLPAGTTIVLVDQSQGTCSHTTTQVTCLIGTMPNGASEYVIIEVTAPSTAGTITNSASVSSTTTDPTPSNNSDTVQTAVTSSSGPTADLSVTKTASPNPVAQVGANVTYTVTVTNNGPSTATGAVMLDLLPQAVIVLSVTPSQGSCQAPLVNGTLECDIGTLANGATMTLTVVVQTVLAGLIGNSASVFADQADPNFSNNVTGIVVTNVGDVSRLLNISTRAPVLIPPNGMNGGFILTGTFPKTLLIRGRGPSLSGAPFNVSGTLANPTIRLVSAGTTIAQNDNWQTTDPLCLSPATACGNAAQITATAKDPCQPNPGQSVAPPNCSLESALLVTLPPGPYSVVLSGVSNGTGVGLFEVFDVDGTTLPKLSNISTRGLVQASPNLMHGGFIIGAGGGNKQVLIRARGPSMSGAPFNVPGTLTNPTMRVVKTGVTIAQNDDWQTTDPLCGSPAVACGNAADITATGKDPCVPNPTQTVAPPNCANEAALLLTLPPGGYNVVISGVGNTQGLALFEVFDLTP